MFDNEQSAFLVPIAGVDPVKGPWSHRAYVAPPLPRAEPTLSGGTYRQVARTRAALAALDATAQRLPNPSLLRRPILNREAQSTSALEGTYAPLDAVLNEDEAAPSSTDLREILNYVEMADHAFDWVQAGRPLTVGLLGSLQSILVAGTAAATAEPGLLRQTQVVIGRRSAAAPSMIPVEASRFVPSPPGTDLEARTRDLLDWVRDIDQKDVDPVVAAAMAHYQFETLHPFHDGNGRIGRLLTVLQLLARGVLSEPTLTVSGWFEARRSHYYDHLLAVSTRGSWDAWINFFSVGLEESARSTHQQMRSLLDVQEQLRELVRRSPLRADSALMLVDLAVSRPSFTARIVERDLEVSYKRANTLIVQLVEIGVLEPVPVATNYRRRFRAPAVQAALLNAEPAYSAAHEAEANVLF